MYEVPAELQRRIVAECPAPLRVILYRRFMVRVAEAIARKEGALALVTGKASGGWRARRSRTSGRSTRRPRCRS